jgi:hypothetical protein
MTTNLFIPVLSSFAFVLSPSTHHEQASCQASSSPFPAFSTPPQLPWTLHKKHYTHSHAPHSLLRSEASSLVGQRKALNPPFPHKVYKLDLNLGSTSLLQADTQCEAAWRAALATCFFFMMVGGVGDRRWEAPVEGVACMRLQQTA